MWREREKDGQQGPGSAYVWTAHVLKRGGKYATDGIGGMSGREVGGGGLKFTFYLHICVRWLWTWVRVASPLKFDAAIVCGARPGG